MGRIIGWLTAAVTVTVVLAGVYLAFQQTGLRSANDAAQELIGSDPLPGPRLELDPASGVFIIIYGADDKPESGTATLHKEMPGSCRCAANGQDGRIQRRDLAARAGASDGIRRAGLQQPSPPNRSRPTRTGTGSP